jgi:maltose O-acetyltransferase
VYVRNSGTIRIGERVQIESRFAPTLLTTSPGGLLEIGDRTFINFGVDICATQHVRIGDDCLIGTHVTILDNSFHEVEDRSRMPAPRPVDIGNRVWIGNHAIILPGVTVGDDSVVGAGSVVVTDVPPRSVVVGNPAKVVRDFAPLFAKQDPGLRLVA